MTYTPFIDLLIALLCPSPSSILDSSTTSPSQDEPASSNQASTSRPSTSNQSRTAVGDRVGRKASSPGRNIHGRRRNSNSPSPERSRSPGQGQPGRARAAAAQRGQGRILQPSAFQALFALHEHSAAYRDCFLAALRGPDCQLACAAVRTLVAVLQSTAVSSEVLDAAGMALLMSDSVLASRHPKRSRVRTKSRNPHQPTTLSKMLHETLSTLWTAVVIGTWLVIVRQGLDQGCVQICRCLSCVKQGVAMCITSHQSSANPRPQS